MCKPLIRTAKGKKIKPQFEYNKLESEYSITIPEDAAFPISLTLGAGVKIPSPKVLELLVGSAREGEPKRDDKKFGLNIKVIKVNKQKVQCNHFLVFLPLI